MEGVYSMMEAPIFLTFGCQNCFGVSDIHGCLFSIRFCCLALSYTFPTHGPLPENISSDGHESNIISLHIPGYYYMIFDYFTKNLSKDMLTMLDIASQMPYIIYML